MLAERSTRIATAFVLNRRSVLTIVGPSRIHNSTSTATVRKTNSNHVSLGLSAKREYRRAIQNDRAKRTIVRKPRAHSEMNGSSANRVRVVCIKLQVPNSKLQAPKAYPGSKIWILGFGPSLEVGTWNLEVSCHRHRIHPQIPSMRGPCCQQHFAEQQKGQCGEQHVFQRMARRLGPACGWRV